MWDLHSLLVCNVISNYVKNLFINKETFNEKLCCNGVNLIVSNPDHCRFTHTLHCQMQKTMYTSSPKGNDRSPESNVPRSNLILKKHINGPLKPEAEIDGTHLSFYVCPGYSTFYDDSIKYEWASMDTPFSYYKSMGNFLDLKGS